jgi:ABC-type multidrug transport system fused ATPase/permease subunit
VSEEKIKLEKGSFNQAKRIFAYMAPYKWRYIIGLVFLLLTSLVFLLFTQLMQYLVDSTGIQDELPYDIPGAWGMKEIGLLLLVVLAIQAVFSFFRVYLFLYVAESSLADFRRAAFHNLIALPMSYFSGKNVGEINSRLASDIGQIQEVLNTTVAELLRQAMIVVGGVIILFFTQMKLTGLMLAIVPVMAIAAVIFGRHIRRLSRTVQDSVAESTSIVQEIATGIVNVKAFTNELLETVRYDKAVNSIRAAGLKAAMWRGAFAAFIVLCIFGTIVGVFWYAMALVEGGQLSYGQMFKFMLLAMTIGISIGGMAELYASLQKGIGATDRVFEIIDEKPEQLVLVGTKKAAGLKGQLSFEKVNFRYPTREDVTVLKELSFTVNPGEQVAIVGPSGAGKSTITALVMRFYDPTDGVIRFDGTPAQDYDLSELRGAMAVVPQEVLLFGGTIAENIAYGKPEASDEEIERAAIQANAKEFIERFPDGYKTMVGERGIQLSGGQRQRIAIARAVLNDPSILILDEATSSLDSESERMVQDALDKLMKGRTSIVIAHRLSTIKKADKIIVLENGMLKEQGRHAELMLKEDGLYKHLSTLQFQV